MLIVCSLIGATLLLALYGCLERQDVWSISIYQGADPFSLKPHPLVSRHPVLMAADVTDTRADFVADPFMLRFGGRWYLFFEVLESSSRRGVISVASSDNGYSWRYEQVVLREPFHLSYPYVFEWRGHFYMVPESGEAGAVRLYRASQFPFHWDYVSQLIVGKHWDPSLIHHEGRWWLFAVDEHASLTLHHAVELEGPWIRHPQSPVVKESLRIARPGGRLIVYQHSIIRFAQDGHPTYGSALRAFIVDELTERDYREHELPGGPVLTGSGGGWNATGMHHLDIEFAEDGQWLACVDGNRRRWAFNWRLGVRRVLDRIM